MAPPKKKIPGSVYGSKHRHFYFSSWKLRCNKAGSWHPCKHSEQLSNVVTQQNPPQQNNNTELNATLGPWQSKFRIFEICSLTTKKVTPESKRNTVGKSHQSHSNVETSRKTLFKRDTSHFNISIKSNSRDMRSHLIKIQREKNNSVKSFLDRKRARGPKEQRTKTVHSMWRISLPLHVLSKEMKRLCC